MIPTTMRAIVQTVYGGPDVLHFADVPVPAPGLRDLLVRVHAVSVNPVDAKRRGGGAPGTPVEYPPQIVGWDAAGEVVAVGAEVAGFAPGDPVFFAGDITRPGSYAEYVAVDERIVGPKPATLGYAEAAAVPLTALTAWEGIVETLGAADRPGAPILIVGGAGGVGSIAIQIAKTVCDLHVVATASRPASEARCRELGADAVIDHTRDFAPQLEALGVPKVPFVFSTAPLDAFGQLVSVLAPLGHICLILGGPPAQALDVSGLMSLRGTVSWELMFTRPMFGVEPERQGRILAQVAERLDAGTLHTTATEVLSWRDVAEAHRRIETGHTMGKIVLTIDRG